jgi:hypothetical protein
MAMIAPRASFRKLRRAFAVLALLMPLSACLDTSLPQSGAAVGGPVGAPVKVALLLPKSDQTAATVAQSLENAARLAIADNPRRPVELTVYDTAGQAATAAAQAQAAVDAGAQIILGPLFGAAANAVGRAVADEGVTVLSFSNTPSIAGGNVFVLGQTFENTADRLLSFAARQGRGSMVLLHPADQTGQIARVAVEQAAARAGLRVIAAEGYPLSVEGVAGTAQRARASAQAGADTVFITTDATNAAMPMLLQMLPENGLTPGDVQYIGLTRWDIRPDLFTLPGAEGSWFAVPDRASQQAFEARYSQTFGSTPHPLSGLAYDGIAAIMGIASGNGATAQLDTGALTRSSGFQGAGGRFRLLEDGTTSRALAVATIQMRQVTILDPAPSGITASAF